MAIHYMQLEVTYYPYDCSIVEFCVMVQGLILLVRMRVSLNLDANFQCTDLNQKVLFQTGIC